MAVVPNLNSSQTRIRRSRTTAEALAFIGAEGELAMDLQAKQLRIHVDDGRPGGYTIGDVINLILHGFVAGPSTPVLATDTVLQAFQKLQAEVSSLIPLPPHTGGVPQLAVNTVSAGTSATVGFTTFEDNPSDAAHFVKVQTGTDQTVTSGTLWTCTFAQAYPVTPHVLIVPVYGTGQSSRLAPPRYVDLQSVTTTGYQAQFFGGALLHNVELDFVVIVVP